MSQIPSLVGVRLSSDETLYDPAAKYKNITEALADVDLKYASYSASDLIECMDKSVLEVAPIGATEYDYLGAGQVKFFEGGPDYSTRDKFVAAKTRGRTWSDGTTSSDGRVEYLHDSTAVIAGLPAGVTWYGDKSLFHFGAAGDGVTDDTAAVQAAFDTSGDIHVPMGYSFLVTSTVDILSDTYLHGGGTILAGPVTGFTDDRTGAHTAVVIAYEQDGIRIDGPRFDTRVWDDAPTGKVSGRAILFWKTDNTIVENGTFDVASAAFSGNSGDNHIARNNVVRLYQPGSNPDVFADSAIDYWAVQDTPVGRVQIVGNQVTGNGWGRWAFQIGGQQGTADEGAYASNISDNIATGMQQGGIWVFGRQWEFRGCVIADNYLEDMGDGHGIQAFDIRDLTCTGNVVKTCGGYGFWATKATAQLGTIGLLNSTIANNLFIDTATDVSEPFTPAIFMEEAHNCLVTNNAVRGTGHGRGIRVGSACTNTLVTLNYVDPAVNEDYVNQGATINPQWGNAEQPYIPSNLLGTVSETSGVPTGSAFESGADYVRDASGWQTCRGTVTFTFLGGSQMQASWTFPMPFSSAPAVTCVLGSFASVTPANTEIGTVNQAGLSATACTFNLFRIEGMTNFVSGDTITAVVTAEGKWS